MSKAEPGGSGRPTYTLTVACSRDGFISRSETEPPQAWASAEEQALFFRDVEAADWAIMGRNTHLAADRPDRRRIIFSTTQSGWQRPTQLWLNPAGVTPGDLPGHVAGRGRFETGLILGGTRVHDWFRQHGAIDRVHLTIEPVIFGEGLPIFTDAMGVDPVDAVAALGLEKHSDEVLNAAGTRYQVWARGLE